MIPQANLTSWLGAQNGLYAGRLALFQDRAAADQVTRRGREVLAQVVDALRSRGMTLIEVDTNGAFFSTPEGGDEADERRLIADVDATLLTLEFDGRAQAMLSHEVKNYALLRHDDLLKLRGAAFESSRTGAYGRAFLQQALRALLSGDVPGVRQAFLDARRALETQASTNADVASRVRLTTSARAVQRHARRAPGSDL